VSSVDDGKAINGSAKFGKGPLVFAIDADPPHQRRLRRADRSGLRPPGPRATA
jgi:hypothetical protein